MEKTQQTIDIEYAYTLYSRHQMTLSDYLAILAKELIQEGKSMQELSRAITDTINEDLKRKDAYVES